MADDNETQMPADYSNEVSQQYRADKKTDKKGRAYSLKLKKEEFVLEQSQSHRIGVDLSDPNHEMASKRKEKITKFIKVKSPSKEEAIEKAKAHYKKAGFRVHDAYHHSMVEEYDVSQTNEEVIKECLTYKQFIEKINESSCSYKEKMKEEKDDEVSLDETIKGWKHAHSDIARARASASAADNNVTLVRLKKDGKESNMHDATKTFKSEDEARAHHANIVKLNPGKNIAHNLYVGGKHKEALKEDEEKEPIKEEQIDELKSSTLRSYADKVMDRVKKNYADVKAGKMEVGEYNKSAKKDIDNRNKALDKAAKKSMVPSMAREEVEIEESVATGEYKTTHEKSEFTNGYRPKIVHKKTGKLMYLSQHSYKTPEGAKEHAEIYLDAYGQGGEKYANRKASAHAKQNAIKEESEKPVIMQMKEWVLESTDVEKAVHKALSKHIKDYNEGSLDADALGEKTVKAAKSIAGKHGIEHKEAQEYVNKYIDKHVKD